jgi:photosystem II stability/assembly factor-like uncharacterized protein
MTSVGCAPKKPNTIWAGAAGGGVWKSDDGGQHWRELWYNQPTLNIGSIAVDPTIPTTVYCGTGEANLSADSYAGVGVFRSTDGGDTWQILARRIRPESPPVSGASLSIRLTQPTSA